MNKKQKKNCDCFIYFFFVCHKNFATYCKPLAALCRYVAATKQELLTDVQDRNLPRPSNCVRTNHKCNTFPARFEWDWCHGLNEQIPPKTDCQLHSADHDDASTVVNQWWVVTQQQQPQEVERGVVMGNADSLLLHPGIAQSYLLCSEVEVHLLNENTRSCG